VIRDDKRAARELAALWIHHPPDIPLDITRRERLDFFNLRPIPPQTIKGVGGSSIAAYGLGDIRLRVGTSTYMTLHDCLYVPEATVRLISIGSLSVRSKITTHFNDEGAWLTPKDNDTILARGILRSNCLYNLVLNAEAEHTYLSRDPPPSTWHGRLGHPFEQIIVDMAKKQSAEGMPIDLSKLNTHSKCHPLQGPFRDSFL
jgi:hypothetical protein